MPFLQAEESVVWEVPTLVMHDQQFSPHEPLASWDYLTPLTLVSEFTVDSEMFLMESGLAAAAIADCRAVAQVDCLATGFRSIVTAPLADGVNGRGLLELPIPPDQVAEAIEVRQLVVLARQVEPNGPVTAVFPASRVQEEPAVHTFRLEGDGGAFPTEAFPFADAGFPVDALWLFRFEADRLEESFLATARVFINTQHPQSGELLSGKPSPTQSVLFTSLLGEMLSMVALSDTELQAVYEDGSAGQVLQGIVETYLGVDLPTAVEQARNSRGRFLAQIQDRTSFMQVIE